MRINTSRSDSRDRRWMAHGEEIWAAELCDLQQELSGAVEQERGMLRHLHCLQESYGQQTPVHLSEHELLESSKQLGKRYERVHRHVEHLVQPKVSSSRVLKTFLRENLDADVYYRSIFNWRGEILEEMQRLEYYWKWIAQHKRLPGRLRPWGLYVFNVRSISHPWQKVHPKALETLARLEQDLHL